MKFIVEFKSFYKVGDIVLIEYWWDDMITPVKILETSPTLCPKCKKSYPTNTKFCINDGSKLVSQRNKLLISHNIPQSKINNAPDEIIKTSDIIDHSR